MSIVHDLKSAFEAISMAVDVLRAPLVEGPTATRQRPWLDIIERNVQLALNLVDSWAETPCNEVAHKMNPTLLTHLMQFLYWITEANMWARRGPEFQFQYNAAMTRADQIMTEFRNTAVGESCGSGASKSPPAP